MSLPFKDGSQRGVDHSKNVRTPCLNYANFTQITQILRKIRKISKIRTNLGKIRKVYATSEGLTTQKSSNTFREIRIFLLKVRKFHAKSQNTQNLRNNAKFTANLRKNLLRSYTKILSGQPLGSQY